VRTGLIQQSYTYAVGETRNVIRGQVRNP